MKDFKYPVLKDFNGDLLKRWYIEYYFKHPETDKMERFQVWVSNKLKTISARRKVARELKESLSERLDSGWSPFQDEIPEAETLVGALQRILEYKYSTLKPKTTKAYKSISDRFFQFLVKNRMANLKCYQFTPNHAFKFLDFLVKQKINNTTYNNNLRVIRILFNALVEREYIRKNPFVKMKMLPEEESNKKAFTPSEIHRLYNHLSKYDHELLLICEFILYCGFRVQEVLSIQVEDLDIHNNTVRLKAKYHKNYRQRAMPINEDFKRKLLRFKHLDDDQFIFSQDLKPGPVPGSYNIVQKKFKKLQAIIGTKRTIYELKHTMATRLVNENVNPIFIKEYLGHMKIENTMKYIRTIKEFHSDQVQAFIPNMRDF